MMADFFWRDINQKDAELHRLRAENEQLQTEYDLLKSCHDDHYQSYLAVCKKLAESGADNERLRGLVGRLVTETHGYKPYARAPLRTRWGCVYCEYVWAYGSAEDHADDCPVVAAREFMEDAG